MRVLVLFLISCGVAQPSQAQDTIQSCEMSGGKPICLGFQDSVCDGVLSKCVSKRAVCFNENQCDFRGFVCKSEADAALTRTREEAFNLSRESYTAKEAAEKRANELQSCVISAATLEAAKACASRP